MRENGFAWCESVLFVARKKNKRERSSHLFLSERTRVIRRVRSTASAKQMELRVKEEEKQARTKSKYDSNILRIF